MSEGIRRSARQTGQIHNQNARDSDPKPKSKKKSRKRGTKSKEVLVQKEGALGTLYDEVEEVPESLQLLNANELRHFHEMSSHSNSAATGVNYWEGKMLEAVVADECEAIIDDLMVGKKGADQNSNKAIRTDFRRPCIAAALAFKKDITKAVSLKLKAP